MRLYRIRTAWLALVVALALHVADEALTGFLDVYNPVSYTHLTLPTTERV